MDSTPKPGQNASIPAPLVPANDEYAIHDELPDLQAWLDHLDSYVPDIKGVIQGDDACQG